MGCFLGYVRLTLAILNLLLFIIFTAIGVMGMLLKFNAQFLYNLLEKATTKWPQKELHDVVQFIQANSSGLAIGFIVIGFAVAVIALIGLIALFCKNRCLAFTYLTLLTILSIAELALIIYLFAIPGNLDKVAFKLLDKSFEHLRKNDSLTEAVRSLWRTLGSDGNKMCCGLNGYEDFKETLEYPPACCRKNTTGSTQPQPQKCDEKIAAKDKVEGCKGKITEFLNKNKYFFVGVICAALVFQIVVLIIMCVLYKKWKVEY
ncbi:Tetraspanin-9 [Taenia solium]|eukprot:TsM_000184300 transcript=TsM_000184300 gene=TsM_000184300